MFIYLKRSKYPRRCLEHAVSAVCHMKAMSPVMISNITVIFLYSSEESQLKSYLANTVIFVNISYQCVIVKPVSTEHVHKHVQNLLNLDYIIKICGKI